MSPKRQQIEISKRALFQRLDRKLRKQGKKLGMTRARVRRGVRRHGTYFIASEKWVEHLHRGLEPLARELGVLRPWETVK